MTGTVEITGDQQFLRDLIAARLLLPSGEPGIFGHGMVFEDVQTRFDAMVTHASLPDKPENLRFPPVMPKRVLEAAGYLQTSPQLCGAVFGFDGGEEAARDLAQRVSRQDDWSTHLSMTGVVLVPAACYPAYPAIAQRGTLPEPGVTLDLGACNVFRHEPSSDPARLQIFHQREMVRIGEEADVLAWRESWLTRAGKLFEQVGLSPALVLASDPFFGRAGKFLANSQREQRLKFEMAVPIATPIPTAIVSFNFHQDHFGAAFGMHLHDGRVASSACVGFGLERIALALFRAHGTDIRAWPGKVQRCLWPDGHRF